MVQRYPGISIVNGSINVISLSLAVPPAEWMRAVAARLFLRACHPQSGSRTMLSLDSGVPRLAPRPQKSACLAARKPDTCPSPNLLAAILLHKTKAIHDFVEQRLLQIAVGCSQARLWGRLGLMSRQCHGSTGNMAVFTAEVAVEDEGSKGSSFGQGGLGATEMSQDLEFVRALW